MRITYERAVSPEVIESFLPEYRESFAHLAELSAAKQVMSDDEFRQLLVSRSTLKLCGWNDDGELAALAIMTHDLSLVPWVSVPFFAKKWPTRFAENRLAYFLTILVRAGERGGPWMAKFVESLAFYSAELDTILLFDCCGFNIDTIDVPEMIKQLGERHADVETERIDFQHYYGYLAKNVGRYDLAKAAEAGVIDLTVPEIDSDLVIDLREATASHSTTDRMEETQ